MTPQAHFQILLNEFEQFCDQALAAAREGNADYLDELLAKTNTHLRAMEALRPQVNIREASIVAAITRVSDKHALLQSFLRQQMTETRAQQSQVQEALQRIQGAKRFADSLVEASDDQKNNAFNAQA